MEDKITKKIYDLYITERNKYLILNSRGQYKTAIYKPMTAEEKNKRRKELYQIKKELRKNNINQQTVIKKMDKPLLSHMIKEHLKGKITIGVFGMIDSTKFICFDVDFKEAERAKEAVYSLIQAIRRFGISDKYIYVSNSGNKGYHIEIFFTEPIEFKECELFFKKILIMSGLNNSYDGAVELRPTAKQKNGVKIPLGCNFRNSDWRTQECWYCDIENGLELIKSYDYILGIQKISSLKFRMLMAKNNNIIDISNQNKTPNDRECTIGHSGFNNEGVNIDSRSVVNEAKNLWKKGLQQQGTRHNTLLFLAKYLRYRGLSQFECQSELINWMERQDRQYYKALREEWIHDIGLIVKYTYIRKYKLISMQEAKIYKEEIDCILKLKQKNKMLIAFALLVHSKQYAAADGVFYISYAQMAEATDVCIRTVLSTVSSLEEFGYVRIIERNISVYDNQNNKFFKLPNKYCLVDKVEPIDIKLPYRCKSTKSKEEFFICLYYFYSEKELRHKVSRRFFEALKSFKHDNKEFVA